MHIYIPFYNSDMTEGRGPMVQRDLPLQLLQRQPNTSIAN
jgi:hypothetical protein